MDNNPFSNTGSNFPFTADDLFLFDPTNSNVNAWAEFGQGRSVSSIMVDTPTLESPSINPFSSTASTPIQTTPNPSMLSSTHRTSSTGEIPTAPTLQRSRTGTKRGSQGNAQLLDMTKNANGLDTMERTSPPAQKRQRRDTEVDPDEDDDSSDGRKHGGGGSESDQFGQKGVDRSRLTEQEKKSNHIASEQKRRMAIRWGFDRLTEIVPGLEGQGRSESIVLKKSVDYMRKALDDRKKLLARVQELGGEVPKDLLIR